MRFIEWVDSSSAWWAKHQHALAHHARLAELEDTYKAAKPFRVEAEPTEDSKVIQFRFKQSKPIPIAISLVLGDVIHNLRSALDNLTFAIVSDAAGRSLTEREELACQFPICQTPDEYERFLASRTRRELYGESVVSVLRAGQPFYWLEQAKSREVENAKDLTYEHDSRFHHLTTINRLSNIDKHRRLTVTALWPSLLYWTTDQGDASQQQYSWVSKPPWQDCDVIGRMTTTGSPPKQVIHEVVLVALDDPAHVKDDTASHGLARVTKNLCDSVAMTMSTVISARQRSLESQVHNSEMARGDSE